MATKRNTTGLAAQAVAGIQAADGVDAQSEARAGLQATVDLVYCLLGGTTAMRQAGEKYLPKWPKENDKQYMKRLECSTLFPAYARTIGTMVGKPFSKPVTYEGVDAQLEQWLKDNADLQGRHLDSFAADCLASAMAYGFCGILVDCPAAPKREDGRPVTMAEESAAGVRPYLVKIELANLLGWRTKSVNGQEMLTQLRFVEWVVEEKGEFSSAKVKQIKVLEPGAWRTYRQNSEKKWVRYAEGASTLTDLIPFVPVYGEHVAFMQGRPPMMELAHLNVKHWQSQSDQDNLLHVARVPILAVIGVDDEKLVLDVGASTAVMLPLGSGLQYVEHGGAAINAGKTSLDDLKEEMRQAGAELLVLKPGQITATQVATENAVGMSALQKMAADLEDALNLALDYCGKWMRKSGSVGMVKLFRDFASLTLAEASTTLLLQMYQAGTLSKETLLQEVKRRGILSDDLDLEKELERIAQDGPPAPSDPTGGA